MLQTGQPEMKLENFLAKGDILSESGGGETRSVRAEDGTALGWVLAGVISRRPLPGGSRQACRMEATMDTWVSRERRTPVQRDMG